MTYHSQQVAGGQFRAAPSDDAERPGQPLLSQNGLPRTQSDYYAGDERVTGDITDFHQIREQQAELQKKAPAESASAFIILSG